MQIPRFIRVTLFMGALSVVFAPAIVCQSDSLASSGDTIQEDAYNTEINALIEEMKTAKTPEEHKAIVARIRKARADYRAAHPIKEMSASEKESKRREMEETLKKDPYQWQIYQLRQSMAKAKTPEERESLRDNIEAVRERHLAEVEARLTPEQRAERQVRIKKNEQMRAELAPLYQQIRLTRNKEERKVHREQMQRIVEKYK